VVVRGVEHHLNVGCLNSLSTVPLTRFKGGGLVSGPDCGLAFGPPFGIASSGGCAEMAPTPQLITAGRKSCTSLSRDPSIERIRQAPPPGGLR
jgi:hypothetical protein